MKKSITFLFTILMIVSSCTKTEIKEVETIVEVEKEVEVEKIVEKEVPIAPELVALSSSSTMTTESDEQTITITATIENTLSDDASINLNFNGSAIIAEDYTVSSEQIVIAAGQTTGTVDLTIIADNEFETGIENITISLDGLSDTVSPKTDNSALQIDITDGKAIVSLENEAILLDESSYQVFIVNLSKALNEDIIINYTFDSANSSYDTYYSSNVHTVITAGDISGSIVLDLNDSQITLEELRAATLTITSVENDDVSIGSIATTQITTNEINEGLLMTTTWNTSGDLFDLRLYDSSDESVLSSITSSSTSEDIFINKNAWNPLDNGTYTLTLIPYSFNGNTPEVVTFTFLDELGADFGGPFTFTANTDPSSEKIPVMSIVVTDGVYTITQLSTSN